jgi:hypothetical protein
VSAGECHADGSSTSVDASSAASSLAIRSWRSTTWHPRSLDLVPNELRVHVAVGPEDECFAAREAALVNRHVEVLCALLVATKLVRHRVAVRRLLQVEAAQAEPVCTETYFRVRRRDVPALPLGRPRRRAGVVFGDEVSRLADWYAAGGTNTRYENGSGESESRSGSAI